MTTSRKTSQDAGRKAAATPKNKPADLQPPATGANPGSPAASVMKQFQKTRSESTGRS